MSCLKETVIGSWIVNLVVNNKDLSIFVNNKDQSRIYDTGADIGAEKEFAVRLTTEAIEELYDAEGDLRMASITRRVEIGSWDAILVVDDDAELSDGLKLILERQGHKVLQARDGRQAREMVDRIHPDLVILDMMMQIGRAHV